MTQSLWSDEGFTFALSQQSILHILRITAQDYNPPLYYLFMHGWMLLFGTSEYTLRLPSFIFHCITVVIAHMYFEEHYDSKGFRLWLATAVVFFCPILLYFAFEARMYSLLALLTMLSSYALLTRRRRLFILTSIAGFYTHYFYLFVWATQLGYSWFVTKSASQYRRLFVVPFLAFVPWVLYMLPKALGHGGGFWVGRPDLLTFIALPGLLLTGYEGVWKYFDRSLLLFSIVSLATVVSSAWITRLSFRTYWFWVVLAFIPSYAILLISYIYPMYVPRYLIFSSLGLCMFLASVIVSLRDTKGLLVGVAILLLFTWFTRAEIDHKHKQDLRSIFSQAQGISICRKRIYVMDPSQIFVTRYYNRGVAVSVFRDAKEVPDYVGKALMTEADFTSVLPIYPEKACVVDRYGDIEIRSLQ